MSQPLVTISAFFTLGTEIRIGRWAVGGDTFELHDVSILRLSRIPVVLYYL